MRRFHKEIFIPLFFCSVPFLLWACSSAPSRPAEILTERNLASSELEAAYRNMNGGGYNDNLTYITDARRRAVAVDDPELRVETSIALGAAFFSNGEVDGAIAEWERAEKEAEEESLEELAALSRVYLAKGRLKKNGGQNGAEISKAILGEMDSLSANKMYTAFAWQTLGLAKKAEGRFGEAEEALMKSLKIHEAELYLESAAFDWFAVASVRSENENYEGALEALRNALAFDRRSENKYGVGEDWLAMGRVHVKAGQEQEAFKAFARSEEIFSAAGLQEKAGEARLLKESLNLVE